MENNGHPHVPGPSFWPAGFAFGVIVALVGIVVATSLVVVGGLIAIFFLVLWVRDLVRGTDVAHAPAVEPERRAPLPRAPEPLPAPAPPAVQKYPRAVFLEVGTLGIGGLIGAAVTLPAIGFMVGPAFLKQGVSDHDVGPVSNFPEGKYVVTTFTSQPKEGNVSRRTAFIRNNGTLGSLPSFTVISNHCAHLGCPVQPNGPAVGKPHDWHDVTYAQYDPSGFGCPCHGGQYDTEGNRTAGPPVRALDRYSFQVKNDHLFLGKPFSVSHVDGTGANAKIHKWTYSFPGEHVNGPEWWLYPIQPPH